MYKMPDRRGAYNDLSKITQEMAREKGIFWEEEQAEIAYEVLKWYFYESGVKYEKIEDCVKRMKWL